VGLTLEPPPDGGLAILAIALGEGGGAASSPIPVFELPLDALDREAPLSHAVQLGWRYAVRQEGQTATVDLRIAEEGSLRPSRITGSDGASDLLRVARRAEARFADAGDFEVRILQLPGLYLDALWLAGAAEDIFLRIGRRGSGRFDLPAEARRRRRIRDLESLQETPEAERSGG
jgi:hypothetical protein